MKDVRNPMKEASPYKSYDVKVKEASRHKSYDASGVDQDDQAMKIVIIN